ncbi:MAG: FAD-dependent monooxygenase [Saprospiraceae bacterium]|nr:FAD-dependent monooxygenase [Saprospiraceae bacterium]
MNDSDQIIIIGAGLCGTLLALRLAQKGYNITVFERRPDMRKSKISAGRSINLALSDRGLKALDLVGLKEKAENLVIPMTGRMIHPMEGNSSKVNYSGRKGEWINSISRGGLNMLLLDEAEKTGLIDIQFNAECIEMDLESGVVMLEDKLTGESIEVHGSVIFGTDGAASSARKAIMDQSPKYRFDFSQKYLDTGYKELEIPAWPDGSARLDQNALHIWPRPGFMMIALPNMDGSFTVTLFLPFEGENSFETLRSDEDISTFFKKYFYSAYQQMPDLLEDFRCNPSSALGTIKCFPWQINGKYLLMGDAAHAVVPFYGQGMNASFEDVFVLDELIEKHDGDWSKILIEYQEIRKIDTDAIADLAQDNFYEMRDGTADPVFMLKRRIELHLEQINPQYYSKYSMVTFRADLPYHYAMVKGRKQDDILMNYAREAGIWENVDMEIIRTRLNSISES